VVLAPIFNFRFPENPSKVVCLPQISRFPFSFPHWTSLSLRLVRTTFFIKRAPPFSASIFFSGLAVASDGNKQVLNTGPRSLTPGEIHPLQGSDSRGLRSPAYKRAFNFLNGQSLSFHTYSLSAPVWPFPVSIFHPVHSPPRPNAHPRYDGSFSPRDPLSVLPYVH